MVIIGKSPASNGIGNGFLLAKAVVGEGYIGGGVTVVYASKVASEIVRISRGKGAALIESRPRGIGVTPIFLYYRFAIIHS